MKDMNVSDLAAKSVSQPREMQVKVELPEGPKDTTPGFGEGLGLGCGRVVEGLGKGWGRVREGLVCGVVFA